MWFEQKNQLHQPNLDKFMEKLYDYLPQQLVTFILVTLFSLLIGLSQRRISLRREGETTLFGTDRTFTFIGILGYLLYILDPKEMHLFMGGGIILGMLLGINYYVKQSQFHVFGVTTIIIALITYCMAPIISTAFLVLCHDGSHRASFHRNETHLYRTCTTDAK
jgi:ABC-type proline/glycine betaine transport system permease subunit